MTDTNTPHTRAENEPDKDTTEEDQDAASQPKTYFKLVSTSAVDNGQKLPPLWMITFADIMAIMLTFFVLMYSMSVIQEEKWEDMTTSLNEGVSVAESPKWYSGEQDTISIEKLDFKRALNLDYLQGLVQDSMQGNEVLQALVIMKQGDRLILSLPSEILFETGEADVSLDGKRAIFALGDVLSRIKNRIEVVGHSDPRPINGGDYISNWDLSLNRALSVSSVLRNVGYERPVVVRGLSSARYDELPDTLPEDERLGFARRVDVVIMKDDGQQSLFR